MTEPLDNLSGELVRMAAAMLVHVGPPPATEGELTDYFMRLAAVALNRQITPTITDELTQTAVRVASEAVRDARVLALALERVLQYAEGDGFDRDLTAVEAEVLGRLSKPI